MRNRCKQVWAVGATVNVGWHRNLKVIGQAVQMQGSQHSGAWLLEAPNGTRYEFTPHRGIQKEQQA